MTVHDCEVAHIANHLSLSFSSYRLAVQIVTSDVHHRIVRGKKSIRSEFMIWNAVFLKKACLENVHVSRWQEKLVLFWSNSRNAFIGVFHSFFFFFEKLYRGAQQQK